MEKFNSFKKLLPALLLCFFVLAISGAILNPNFNPKNPLSIFNGQDTADVEEDVGEADPERLIYTPIDSVPWLGEEIEVIPQIYDKQAGYHLINETDFTCTWEDNDKVGEAKCIVKGKGNYGGTLVIPFTIGKPSGIAECTLVGAIPDKVYTGFEQRPSFTIQKDGQEYEVNEDTFDCTFIDNINKGQATIKVQPKEADRDLWDYDENMPLVVHFNITSRSINDSYFDWTFTPNCDCNGEHKENGTPHTAEITGKIKDAAVSALLNESDWGYNKNVKPGNLSISKSTLIENEDFTVSATDNINAGTAKFTVTGMGNFSGSIADFSFPIVKEEPPASAPSIITLSLTANSKNTEYNGLSQSVSGFNAVYKEGFGYEVTGLDGKTYYVDGIESKASGINANSYETNIDTKKAVVKDAAGSTVGNFDLKVTPGALSISPKVLKVKSQNINKVYDGKELINGSLGLEFDGLIGNDTFIPTFTGKQKEVGVSDNSFTLSPGPGTIEENYTIVPIFGKLTVTKAVDSDKKPDDETKDDDEKNDDNKPSVVPIPKPVPEKAPVRIKTPKPAADATIRLVLKPSEEKKIVTVPAKSNNETLGSNTVKSQAASKPETTVKQESPTIVIKNEEVKENESTEVSMEENNETQNEETESDSQEEEKTNDSEEPYEPQYEEIEEDITEDDYTEDYSDDNEDEIMAMDEGQDGSEGGSVFTKIFNAIKGIPFIVKILLALLPIVAIAVIIILFIKRKREDEDDMEESKEDSSIFFEDKDKTPPNISL